MTQKNLLPLVNYLRYGYEPGGFFTSILADDSWSATIGRSHPGNDLRELKALTHWVTHTVPAQARGSYEAVSHWCHLTDQERRSILEQHGLIYTEQEETFYTLKAEFHGNT